MDTPARHERMIELGLNTSSALVLGFKDQIKYDLYIPNIIRIRDCAGLAIIDMLNLEDPGYEKWQAIYSLEHSTEKLTIEKRVSEGLQYALLPQEELDDMTCIDRWFRRRESFVGSEWFFGYGNIYRFREGKRDQLVNEVEAYFTKNELDDFRKLHESMRTHVRELYKF